MPRRRRGAAIGIAALAVGGTAAAHPDESLDRLHAEVAELNARLDRQGAELGVLRRERGEEGLTAARAAQIRAIVSDVLADSERRTAFAAEGAVAGYDRGFFIASPDGLFKLVVNAQMQARWAMSRLTTRSLAQLNAGTIQAPASGPLTTPPGGTEIRGVQGPVGRAPQTVARTARGFEMRDMKLSFSGHVVDPSWQYFVMFNDGRTTSQTAFPTVTTGAGPFGVSSSGPVAGNASAGPGAAGGKVELEDAFVTKVLDERWSITVGQFKPPLLKEELVASHAQLYTQRSLTNQFFTMKFSQGAQVQYQDEVLRLTAMVGDGGNNANSSAVIGNDRTEGTFSDGAVTARAEVKFAGRWSQFEDLSSVPGEPLAAYLGAAVNWQRGGARLGPATNDSWTVNGGANGAFVPSGDVLAGSGIVILVPQASLQYPNNLPVNGNSPARNITWTVDGMLHWDGLSLFAAAIGNIASGIPSGWAANPSGGFTPVAGTGNGPNTVPGNVSLVPGNGSDGGIAAFVPGYGAGGSPIFSYGVIVSVGCFVTDSVQLYGGWEWYDTLDNGANAYAGNTISFWGATPGGAAIPGDGYTGDQTNPFSAFNLGGNPFAAQSNSIITLGAAWYPLGSRHRQVKLSAEVSHSLRAVLFQQGIFGQSVNSDDWRNDGGQPGGGQVVVRLQAQIYY